MNNGTKISYSQVEGYCSHLNSIAQNMKSKLDHVQTISNNISNVWKGNAASAYIEKTNNLVSNFQDITEQINNSINYMKICSDNYQNIDSQITNSIK